MIANTIERARGRWREILPQLGIETQRGQAATTATNAVLGLVFC